MVPLVHVLVRVRGPPRSTPPGVLAAALRAVTVMMMTMLFGSVHRHHADDADLFV